MSPEFNALASAIRNKAAEVRNVQANSARDDDRLRDAADLLRVLAKVLEGKPLARVFGAPGDWGYETEIGLAVYALIKTTCAGREGGSL